MRHTKIVIIALIMGGALSAAAQECLYKEGLEQFRLGNYSEANSLLTLVLNAPHTCPNVDVADVHYWRAWSLVRGDSLDEAMNDFRLAEASPENGLTARYMCIRIMHRLDPQNVDNLALELADLNSLLADPNIQASLKDKAVVYRNLLRLQLGEKKYRDGDFSRAKDFFQGIVLEDTPIGQQRLRDINALARTSALSWLLHIKLALSERIDASLIGELQAELPNFSDDQPEMQQLTYYFRSLQNLYLYLLRGDDKALADAKSTILALDQNSVFYRSYKSIFDLLEGDYTVVIDTDLASDPFDNYKNGWARFLRNDQTQSDLLRAEGSFKVARDALPKCSSPLRKASAFRFLQVRHFRDRQDGAFVDETAISYFSKECISDPDYIARKELWTAIFEEGYGYREGSCQIGAGYLDIGLYRSSPTLVEHGKKQLMSLKCDLDKDKLSHAILLCIGTNPDYGQAIALLSDLLKSGGAEKDEVRYALAMAYYNNDQAENAIPLLEELVKKGSLDACYKLATIYYDAGKNAQACRYLSAIIQRPEVRTIYRKDANRFYSLAGCGALGVSAAPMPEKSTVKLRYPEYRVFTYDYIGDGYGVIAKLYYEMKSAIVKFIHPLMSLDLFGLKLLEPSPALTAYLHLFVHPLPGGEPTLSLTLDGEAVPGAALQNSDGVYTYHSGPLDMGEFTISIRQQGSFGWSYENFISGNFHREILLDSAFVFQPLDKAAALESVSDISYACFANDGITIFTPDYVVNARRTYNLPHNFGAVASAAMVGNEYYCLVSEQNAVKKVSLFPPDSIVVAPFIRGVYDPKTDITEYGGGLKRPLKIEYIADEKLFYILNADGMIYEFDENGYCIGSIDKPASSAFIIDIVYDADENCLWLLDIASNLLHAFDLGVRRYDLNRRKKLDDRLHPLSLAVDSRYFYIADIDGQIGLFKKGSFRRLKDFSLLDEKASFVNFALVGRGLNDKKLLIYEKQTAPGLIRALNRVHSFKTQFDEDYQSED